MNNNASGNPVCGEPMRPFVDNVNSEAFERLKAALKKPYGMFGSDADHRDMVVEDLVVRLVAFGPLKWRYEPCLNLSNGE